MTTRRSLGGVAIVLLLMLLAAALIRHFTFSPATTVFELHEVRPYTFLNQQPVSIYGDHQIEADFKYLGPELSPMSGRVNRFLYSWKLITWPKQPPMVFGDITLLDEGGHLLATLKGNGNAATTQSARCGFMGNGKQSGLVFLWNFVLPPKIDSSQPVRFSTTLSVNNCPPVPVLVTIPGTSRPASKPSR